MAKINWQDIGQLNDNDQKTINQAIIIPAKEALRQTRNALNKNLTIRDNQYAAVMTFGTSITPMTSGTEFTFQNPLKTTPIGFSPLVATNTAGVPIVLAGHPRLNTTRTDGLLGLTAYQDLIGGTGSIGQYFSVRSIRSGGPALTTGTIVTLVSLTVTPGDYDLSAIAGLSASTNLASIDVAISLTAATLPATDELGNSWIELTPTSNSGADEGIGIPALRVTPIVTTTYFLVIRCSFSLGAASGYGRLSARRMTTLNSNPMILTGILWGG